MRRQIIKVLLLMVGLLVVIALRQLILGGAGVISQHKDPLSLPISQALQAAAGNDYLPIEGHDYQVSQATYLDNKQFAIVRITPLNSFGDPLAMVLQLSGASYKVVVQPVNNLNTTNLTHLPTNVVQYIIKAKL